MTAYKRTFVPQIDARDCGVAALASIAKFYGSDYSLAHLRELAKTNKEGNDRSWYRQSSQGDGL
ncbi:hypothetical protein C4K59_002371 [Streptococcus thermophilus]|uniref:Bacteriocin processing peptidase n=1 Tax=Streptococcus thermophilus TaxID=1308 RepID=A0A2X3U5J2_STRTR|nr:hypothetical protein C4K59_002371 [Streptococcus thermophilus]SQF24060.1 bacteriocin processing peptidase [Streptococcus thermophilus]